MSFTPYLTFNGQCREAMQHYADCFGGQIDVMDDFSKMPSGDGSREPANRAHILHARLRLRDTVLMASDTFDAKMAMDYSGFSISVGFDDMGAAQAAFDKISADGLVTMPFAPSFWAKGFGMARCKYGVGWMINCE